MEYHAAVKEDVQVFHELMWKVFQHLSLNIRASCIEERVWIHIFLYLQKERLEKMSRNYLCIFVDGDKCYFYISTLKYKNNTYPHPQIYTSKFYSFFPIFLFTRISKHESIVLFFPPFSVACSYT